MSFQMAGALQLSKRVGIETVARRKKPEPPLYMAELETKHIAEANASESETLGRDIVS